MRTFLVVAIGLGGLSWSPVRAADQQQKAAPPTEAGPAAATPPMNLTELIARVRENEALIRNLAATVRISWKVDQGDNQPAAQELDAGEGGQSLWRGTEHILRIVTDGDRLFFSDDEVVALGTDVKVSGKQVARCNGTQTVVIDEKSCAMVFRGRYEPGRMLPPHTWGLFALNVSFPLSVYLEGTAALKAHPRGRWFPAGASLSEIKRDGTEQVETEWVGEEAVGDLACVKVKLRRWHYNSDAPLIHYLWLARDRNYHVAQSQTAWLRNGIEVADEPTRVVKWREVAKGVWLPALVTSKAGVVARTLTVDAARLNPRGFAADFFALPQIPESLPKFVIGDDGRVEESPLHPTPAQADPATTLESILARLVEEEARYDRLEVTTNHHYELLAHSPAMDRATLTFESKEMSVLAGSQLLYSQERTSRDAHGESISDRQQRQDGGWTREVYRSSAANHASLVLDHPDELEIVRPHTLLFRHGFEHRPLSQILKSGRLQRTKLVVEYVGDERVADLHCHKLKYELPDDQSQFFLWLARDRNLIPVRRAWHRSGWSATFPETLDWAEDFREVTPGVWFPHRTTLFWFQFSREDGRPLPQWRQEIRVESLTLNSTVAERFFREVDVPKGTPVLVRDEQDNFIGRFNQPRTGNIDVRPEELRAMRQTVRVSPEESDRRRKALDALIGRAAPALPPETWLNSPALSWDDLAGKVVVISFWAHWSLGSDADLKRLAEQYQREKEEKITDVVLLGLHTAGSERDDVLREVSDRKLGYAIVIDRLADGGGPWGDLFDRFAVRELPTTVIVDGRGKIVAHGKLELMLLKAAELSGKNRGDNH